VVRLRNAALNRRDVFATRGQYPGAKPEVLPVVLGSDGSGEVAAKGDGADGLEEGSEVVIHPSLFWGDDPRIPGKNYRILGLPEDGTYAQFVKVPAENVFPKALAPLARGGRRRPARGAHRLPGAVHARAVAGGRDGLDHRRRGRGGDVPGADGERRRGDGLRHLRE
jgi:hypothetical protein